MANRSSFPNQIDSFIEHVDISPSDIVNVQRYQELKLKSNKTSAEIEELNNLTALLRDKILTPEDFNKLQDAMVNIETFTKDTLTNYYKYMGEYNSTTAYKTFNSVMYNGDIYLALYDVQGVLPTDTSKWLKISQKGDKGDKAFNWKGVYNNNTAYIVDDVVYYNGSSYVCIRSSTGNLPTNVAYWNPVSLKGSDGVGYKFKGAWNSSYAYNLDDAVSYDNKIYYCIQANVGQVPTNADYWLEFLTQETQANQISITDVNGYYVSANVEDALKEVWEAKETPAGAQAKVNAHANASDPHPQYALDTDLNSHAALKSAHGATSAATANTIIMRDASGRAKVAAPSASDDIARKDTVDNHAGVTSAISTLGHVYEAEFTATITAASWSGTTPPYSNAVTASGIKSSHNPIIDVTMSGTYSTDQQRCEQWGNIYRAVTSSNTITFYAHEKPTIDLPIRVKVVM